MIKIHAVALAILITDGLVEESFEGDHNLQRRYRCELDGDGSRRGSVQYYFDGDDFFSLDLTPGTWNTANARAENFITEWDRGGHQAEYWKNFLYNTCIERLMQYVQSRTNTEKRKGTRTLQYITDITAGISYTVGELDGEQFVSYGSNVTEVILKTEWIKKIDADDPNYRKREKDRMSDEHGDLQDLLNQAKKHFNQTKGENKVSPTDEESSKSNVAIGAAIGVVVVVLLIAVVVHIIYRRYNNSDLTQMKPVNALLMSSSGTEGYIQVSSV